MNLENLRLLTQKFSVLIAQLRAVTFYPSRFEGQIFGNDLDVRVDLLG